ncbi:MAG: ferrous iron transport protein A [Bacillota bacterium]
MAQELPLNKLGKGEVAAVTRVGGQGSTRRRLMEMGVIPGVQITIKKIAPLGDPIDVLVKGYHLSLRRREAAEIFVEVV